MVYLENNDIKRKLNEPVLNQKKLLSLIHYDDTKLKTQVGDINFKILIDFDHFFKLGVFIYQWVTKIMAGNIFGELALITNSPRSSTMVANEDIHLAVLNKCDYEKIFLELERYKINKLTDFFSENIISNISRDTVLKFTHIFEKKHYSTNQIIYKEGDLAQNYYLIKKGEVNVNFKIWNDF